MRKMLTAATAALTLGGAIAATASPAEARGWNHGGYHGGYGYGGHYHNNDGAAVAAGVVGLALGAALASGGHSYAYGPSYSSYYGPAYYGPAYYGPPAYRVCESERWVWDPYWRRHVPVRTRYAC